MTKATRIFALLSLFLSFNPAHADLVDKAIESYQSGKVVDAIAILQPLVKHQNTRAESALGAIYYNEGGEAADEKAFGLFLKAAQKNDVEAQYNLANMYMYVDKLPVQVDDQDIEAARWYFEAGNQGHADAQYTLGLLLLAGTGVIHDPDEAYLWISLAAEQGHQEAQNFIGVYE